MPNWCENKLTIKGDKNLIKYFKVMHFTEDKDLDFNTIIAYPKTIGEAISNGYEQFVLGEDRNPENTITDKNFDWYNWHWDCWGTKWNAYDTSYDEYDGELIIYYNTAWNPAIPIVKKLQEIYRDATITSEYYEGGNAFYGYVYSDGNDENFDFNISDINDVKNVFDMGYISYRDWFEYGMNYRRLYNFAKDHDIAVEGIKNEDNIEESTYWIWPVLQEIYNKGLVEKFNEEFDIPNDVADNDEYQICLSNGGE